MEYYPEGSEIDDEEETVNQEQNEQIDYYNPYIPTPRTLGKFTFQDFLYVSKGVKFNKRRGWVCYFQCCEKSVCSATANVAFAAPDMIKLTNNYHECTRNINRKLNAHVMDVCEKMKDRADELAISNPSSRVKEIWRIMRTEYYAGLFIKSIFFV